MKTHTPSRPQGIQLRTRLSVIGVLFLSTAAGLLSWFSCQTTWTPLQRYYWTSYVNTEVFRGRGEFDLLEIEDRQHRRHLAKPVDVVADGSRSHTIVPLALSTQAKAHGGTRVIISRLYYESTQLHEFLRWGVYGGESATEMSAPAWVAFLSVMVPGLMWAFRRSRAFGTLLRDGLQLKGPERVTTSLFNRWSGSDGIGFTTTEGQILAMPRSLESSHIMVMGDSGSGKSALLRQVLMQIAARGENAIVYDPALEYTPQFYDQSRGDLILNPLDTRCPYWSPADEVTHEAEALTIAASLFPDKPRENTFFVDGPRKIFAYLLTLKPTPEKLVWWMSHENEIDQLVQGTELSAFVYRGAGPQRGGVLGALNMVADSMRLLPKEEHSTQRWSSAEWARARRGWIFLTSLPRFRERLLPLTSLWLDTLVLRLMNIGEPSKAPVWFVLDELASLQKLPQLHTALTENRKSNNPVVIGFQGRSQLEVRYGHEAEAMLSQPAIKLFLHTSEPRAAKWISDTIGEVEIERLKESVSRDQFPGHRRSRSYHTDRHVEPLVLASEITGLPRLHALLKVDNFVVRFAFPYIQLANTQLGFVPRADQPVPAQELPAPAVPSTQDSPSVPRPTKQKPQTPKKTETQQPFFFE